MDETISARLLPRISVIRLAAITGFLTTAFIAAGPGSAGPVQNCAPVEVVPGVKQVPRGCPVQAKPAEAKRDPHDFRVGDTDVKISGRVRAEYGARRN